MRPARSQAWADRWSAVKRPSVDWLANLEWIWVGGEMTFLDPGLEIGSPGDMDLTGDVLIASTGADESHGCWSNDVGPYAGEIQDVANQVIPASGLEVGDGMGLLMTRAAQDQAIPPAPFEPDAETPE